jgi:hypothetical protein
VCDVPQANTQTAKDEPTEVDVSSTPKHNKQQATLRAFSANTNHPRTQNTFGDFSAAGRTQKLPTDTRRWHKPSKEAALANKTNLYGLLIESRLSCLYHCTFLLPGSSVVNL